MKIFKSSLKIFDFTPIGSTALFHKIKFILGNNAVEPIGVKSNIFRDDLKIFIY